MADKIKTGELRVAVADEEIIWCDRKRKTIFALPWSFTKYTLTKSRLFVKKGFFKITEDEVRLYRIRDISYSQTFAERLGGTGTLCLLSSDASVPEVHLTHIKQAKKIKDVISQCVEEARRENGVRTSELVGGGPVGGYHEGEHFTGDGHDHPSMGPEIVPDFNHDGIDDRDQ